MRDAAVGLPEPSGQRRAVDGSTLTGREGLSGSTSPCNEQPTQNWYGQRESDCLIKTKHPDGANAC
jgi:hypothetical protein